MNGRKSERKTDRRVVVRRVRAEESMKTELPGLGARKTRVLPRRSLKRGLGGTATLETISAPQI